MKTILTISASILLALPLGLRSAEPQSGEMFGYLLFDGERVPAEFNAGFSLYAAAWPLVDHYPGHEFQTGLVGTWMHPQYTPGQKPREKCYTDIEGGLGWWRDTHFPTVTPKFIMGGVGPNFSVIANGPGYGAGSWKEERGLYGVVQLSPWLLFPLDGLNLQQGVKGELFGYGYLPLPLTEPKTTTAGANVPTGNQCWTLFLNTANFKGPAAFFTQRFADQPAMLNADLTAGEREQVQQRVEKLQRAWTRDRDYLAPPEGGQLAAVDPALILTPPKGLEIGYVPIATRQELPDGLRAGEKKASE